MRFEVFTVVKIQVEVFWVVIPCSVAVRYQCFGGEDGGRKVPKNVGIHHNTTQCHNLEDDLKQDTGI
jgi:hypothetical protein